MEKGKGERREGEDWQEEFLEASRAARTQVENILTEARGNDPLRFALLADHQICKDVVECAKKFPSEWFRNNPEAITQECGAWIDLGNGLVEERGFFAAYALEEMLSSMAQLLGMVVGEYTPTDFRQASSIDQRTATEHIRRLFSPAQLHEAKIPSQERWVRAWGEEGDIPDTLAAWQELRETDSSLAQRYEELVDVYGRRQFDLSPIDRKELVTCLRYAAAVFPEHFALGDDDQPLPRGIASTGAFNLSFILPSRVTLSELCALGKAHRLATDSSTPDSTLRFLKKFFLRYCQRFARDFKKVLPKTRDPIPREIFQEKSPLMRDSRLFPFSLTASQMIFRLLQSYALEYPDELRYRFLGAYHDMLERYLSASASTATITISPEEQQRFHLPPREFRFAQEGMSGVPVYSPHWQRDAFEELYQHIAKDAGLPESFPSVPKTTRVISPLGRLTAAGLNIKYPGDVMENLAFVRELHKRSGYEDAPRFLHEQYGIRNFVRYPEELLRDQYDHRGDRGSPYLLLLTATGDMEGSFMPKMTYEHGPFLRDLLRQCKEKGLLIRTIEAAQGREVLQRFSLLERRHGTAQAHALIVSAHGARGMLELGPHVDGLFRYQDLKRMFGQKSQGIITPLSPSAPMIFNVCSMANDWEGESPAQMLAVATQRMVVASTMDGILSRVQFDFDGSMTNLDVEFRSHLGLPETRMFFPFQS